MGNYYDPKDREDFHLGNSGRYVDSEAGRHGYNEFQNRDSGRHIPHQGPGCFAAKTLVTTPTGEMRIEGLQVGDDVVSMDTSTQQLVINTITKVQRFRKRRLYAITFEHSPRTLYVTKYHPLLIWDGWKKVHKLAPGDSIFRMNDLGAIEIDYIKEITRLAKPADVYNIYTSGPKNYCVEGVFAHNYNLLFKFRERLNTAFSGRTEQPSFQP